jgi:outer membrane protein
VTEKRPVLCLTIGALLLGSIPLARADENSLDRDVHPSIWIVELGGYGVVEPRFEGSRDYEFGFKPIFDVHRSGDRVWFSSPNDAWSFDLYESSNFHAGAAGDVTLKSRFHGDNITARLGSSDLDVKLGAFAEYYPTGNIRTRVELLDAVSGVTGLMLNLSADYIWKPQEALTLSLGPRLQFVDDTYASELFSTRAARATGAFVRYRAEGGINSAGAEFTGTYDWSREFSTKLFADYSSLVGDAADSPRVNLRGSVDQFTVGIGASYKLSVDTTRAGDLLSH